MIDLSIEKYYRFYSIFRILAQKRLHKYDVTIGRKREKNVPIDKVDKRSLESIKEQLYRDAELVNNSGDRYEVKEIHTTFVLSKDLTSPDILHLCRVSEFEICILKPFDEKYPEMFLEYISDLSEDEIDDFLEFQYNKCNSLEKKVFSQNCLSIIDEVHPDFKQIYSLKYWLIRSRLEKGFEFKSNSTSSDKRINGKLSNEKIIQNLKILTDKQEDGKPVLTEEEFDYFLRANFIGFNPKVEPKKIYTPNFNQMQLRRLFYKLYELNRIERSTDPYVNLLINNFYRFNNTSFEVEKRNFSK